MTSNDYGLERVSFNVRDFEKTAGNRLDAAGLSALADRLSVIGLGRDFLEKELSDEDRLQINDSATPIVAQDAALFQEVVAKVKVEESGERMVNLEYLADINALPWSFSVLPYHAACGDWAGKPRLFWVRERVGQALLALTTKLSSAQFGLHFEDAFRPLGVQEGLFARRYTMTLQDHPNWTDDQILLETKSKTAYTPRFAAHKGGAAIDVRLVDRTIDSVVDIGHGYPDGGAIVAMDSPYVTQTQWVNRHILNVLASEQGFSAYPYEDWHFSISDTTAAACNLQNGQLSIAQYGPIKHFDISSGEIVETYTQSELDEVFDYRK